MPTVKVWSPSVETQSLPSPSGVAGGGVDVLAEGVRDVGRAIGQAIEQNQLDALTKAETEFQASLNDAHDRVAQAKGSDAAVVAAEAGQAVEKRREVLSQGFQSPAAQRAFLARSGTLMESTKRQVKGYVRQQRDEESSQTLVARKAVGLNAVAQSAFDDEAFAAQLGALESAVNADEAVKGRPHVDGAPDANVHVITQARRQEVRQRAVAVRLNALIGSESPGGIAKAREVLETNRELLGDQVGQYEGQIKAQAYTVDGATKGREIADKSKTSFTLPWDVNQTPIGRVDPNVAEANLAEFEADPTVPEPVKRIARERVEHLVRISNAYADNTLSVTYDRAITKIEGAGWQLSAASQEKAFLLDPKVNGGKHWAAIEDRVAQKRRELNAKPETPEQRSAMVEFLVSFPDRMGEYGSMGVSKFNQEWGGRLSPKDLERAAAHVSQFGIASRKSDETLPAWALKEIVTEGVPLRGSLWGVRGPKTPDQVATYTVIVQDLLAEQQRLKLAGKPLDPDTVKKRISYWTTRGVVEGSGIFGSDFLADYNVPRARAAAATDYDGKTFIEEVPQKLRLELWEQAYRAGRPTSPEWLRWYYNDSLGIPEEKNPRPPEPPPIPRSLPTVNIRDVEPPTGGRPARWMP